MADTQSNILLDQNIPLMVAVWLREQRPSWHVDHVNELGFAGKPDHRGQSEDPCAKVVT
jgi:hypothetical protein